MSLQSLLSAEAMVPFSIMPSKSTRPSFFSLKVDDDFRSC